LVDPNASQKAIIDIPSGAPGLGAAAFGANPKTVSAGTTVVWVNQDSVTHTVTSSPDGSTFDSGNIPPGCAWGRTFNDKGNYPYSCRIHPSMNGTLSVN
jgi:plastocyanin